FFLLIHGVVSKTMLCPPTMRPASPAESEISVGGAPSPLPNTAQNRNAIDLLHHQQQLLMHQHAVAAASAAGLTRAAVGSMPEEYFQPLKRLRMSEDTETSHKERSPSPVASQNINATTTTASSNTKSNLEGVKSFSIADILGHEKRDSSSSPPPSVQRNSSTLLQPRTEPLDIVTGMQHPAAMLLPGTAHVVRPWDHLLGPMPVRPFIPSALLHYEQRLALDYHRQLQEHFNAQAQLLRHMNGMDIIPSESGSERSSSAASDCCSPEINRSSGEIHTRHSPSTQQERSQHNSSSASGATGNNSSNSGNGASSSSSSGKTKPNGTPLDALFQMTTKDFDEEQDKSHLDIFSNPAATEKRNIFELEKRFLYQKYLSPADRDEICRLIGSIQCPGYNLVSKQAGQAKRDIEELKKILKVLRYSRAINRFWRMLMISGILKKKPLHPDAVVMEGLAAAAAAGMMPVVTGPPTGPPTGMQTLSPQK
ncbi:hypothetical protein DOY81_009307, partial [Sarcophaga bullata]